MMKYFSWQEFDKSVIFISDKCKNLTFSGVYGIPRGGLCLAVALSHKLNIKLISEPAENSLIVDDVYETGLTLNNYRNIEGAKFFVLCSKKEPLWWDTVRLSREKEWIVFPWEDKEKCIIDKEEYINKRS